MLLAEDHATKVSIAVEAGEAIQSKLVASWSRCINGYGLDPFNAKPQRVLTASDLNSSVQEMEDILFSASATLERLRLIGDGVGACVLLAGRNGVPVHSSARPSDIPELQRWGLRVGVDWSEHIGGTNGIGTCLVEKTPLLIHKGQHFYERDIDISCAVAPVFDHVGEIAAALNVTLYGIGTNGSWPSYMVSLVSDAARQIEIDHFHRVLATRRIISVPGPSRTGAALLAVDADDIVVGATRGARFALKLNADHLREGICAGDLLESLRDDLALAERSTIRRALVRNKGNVSAAASSLNISRATMKRKLAYHGLRRKK